MIFVTIGSMFPFDRLIQVVDRWAGHVNYSDRPPE
jgi:UDP-N-acetylglucosamine transferase subunit ALG13